MLKEILLSNLKIIFVGPVVTVIADDLGFYHLGAKDKFWEMLAYSGLTKGEVISKTDRKALDDAKHTGVLNDLYKQFFFEKKESTLLKARIGMTDLNRRLVVQSEDDPAAAATAADAQALVKKLEKFKPKIAAFTMDPGLFARSFRPLFPSATEEKGKQPFAIGASEVWLLGSANVRPKDADALEQRFDDLAASPAIANMPAKDDTP